MSEDLTRKLPRTDSEKIALILTIVQNLETRVDRLERRLDALEQRHDRFEQRVEERLFDTRPIWEKIVADIAQLQGGQTRLEGDVGDIKKSIRDVFYRISAMSDTMVAIQGDYKHMDDRVRELEQRHPKPTNSST